MASTIDYKSVQTTNQSYLQGCGCNLQASSWIWVKQTRS